MSELQQEAKKRGRPFGWKKETTMHTKDTEQTQSSSSYQQTKLKDLSEDIGVVSLSRILLHQACPVPFAGTETTLSDARIKGIKIWLHPKYGYVCLNKGHFFLVERANVIVGYE